MGQQIRGALDEWLLLRCNVRMEPEFSTICGYSVVLSPSEGECLESIAAIEAGDR
jgi:hypothetical protein